jgi:amidohydrolase
LGRYAAKSRRIKNGKLKKLFVVALLPDAYYFDSMIISRNRILSLAEDIYPEQVKWRRWMHQNPELSNHEIKTTAFIKKTLRRFGLKFWPLKMKTGALAIINEKKFPGIALRADIDALPIKQISRLPFKSRNEGVMHACGHDVHAAIVMGAAAVLGSLRDELNGCVKFLFQPAEEAPPGGAAALIKEGALNNPKVDMILGLHVDPSLSVGHISLRDGPMMASVTDFDVTVIGKGGHAARPHLSVDAVAVASEIVGSMQKIPSREIDPLRPVVVTFGIIRGGTARNVIADKAVLKGTARTLSKESLKVLPRLIRRTVGGICAARGAKCEIDFAASYPVLSNRAAANEIFSESFRNLFGKDKIHEAPQTMGGEDFAFYLQKIPGAFMRLGCRNDRIGANRQWHTPDFMVDEKCIYYGTALLIASVFRYLEGRS